MQIVYISLISITALYLLIGITLSVMVFKTERLPYSKIWKYDKILNNLDDRLRDISHIDYVRYNKRGMKLYARLFCPLRQTNEYIFLNHGNTCVYTGMLKYIDVLLNMGFNVFAPEHRGRGASDGIINTFGYLEHKDCLDWLDYLYELDSNAEVIVMGESMGGTISLLMTAKDKRIKAVIEDCCFSNAYYAVRDIMRSKLGIIAGIFMPIINMSMILLTGKSLKVVDAVKAIKDIKVPVLIIHGAKDSKVNVANAHKIHKANTKNRIEIFNDAEHANCIGNDKERYVKILNSFLNMKGL